MSDKQERARDLLDAAQEALRVGLEQTAIANAMVAQGLLMLLAAESVSVCQHGATGVCMPCLTLAVGR